MGGSIPHNLGDQMIGRIRSPDYFLHGLTQHTFRVKLFGQALADLLFGYHGQLGTDPLLKALSLGCTLVWGGHIGVHPQLRHDPSAPLHTAIPIHLGHNADPQEGVAGMV